MTCVDTCEALLSPRPRGTIFIFPHRRLCRSAPEHPVVIPNECEGSKISPCPRNDRRAKHHIFLLRPNLPKRKKRICGTACVLVVRMLGEGRRILVGDLQAKTAGLLEISPELFRPSPFSLPMVIVLIDPGPMELVDDRVKIVVGYRKCKVAAPIGGFRDFAQLADLIENYALARRN